MGLTLKNFQVTCQLYIIHEIIKSKKYTYIVTILPCLLDVTETYM